jgi:small subunit ribosomal protein S27Ae
MAKARVGLYVAKGEQLTRTHKSCPKCGAGVFLAEHPNRRSCGKCGYSEAKSAAAPPVAAPPAPRPVKAKLAKPA